MITLRHATLVDDAALILRAISLLLRTLYTHMITISDMISPFSLLCR